MRWSSILRWAHFLAGMLISVYFMFKPSDGWPAWYENLMTFGVVGFVFWTGVIRWQLPRIRRFFRKRRGAREALQEA